MRKVSSAQGCTMQKDSPHKGRHCAKAHIMQGDVPCKARTEGMFHAKGALCNKHIMQRAQRAKGCSMQRDPVQKLSCAEGCSMQKDGLHRAKGHTMQSMHCTQDVPWKGCAVQKRHHAKGATCKGMLHAKEFSVQRTSLSTDCTMHKAKTPRSAQVQRRHRMKEAVPSGALPGCTA